MAVHRTAIFRDPSAGMHGVPARRGRTMGVVNTDDEIAVARFYRDSGTSMHGVKARRMRSVDGSDPAKVMKHYAYRDELSPVSTRRWRSAAEGIPVCTCEVPCDGGTVTVVLPRILSFTVPSSVVVTILGGEVTATAGAAITTQAPNPCSLAVDQRTTFYARMMDTECEFQFCSSGDTVAAPLYTFQGVVPFGFGMVKMKHQVFCPDGELCSICDDGACIDYGETLSGGFSFGIGAKSIGTHPAADVCVPANAITGSLTWGIIKGFAAPVCKVNGVYNVVSRYPVHMKNISSYVPLLFDGPNDDIVINVATEIPELLDDPSITNHIFKYVAHDPEFTPQCDCAEQTSSAIIKF